MSGTKEHGQLATKQSVFATSANNFPKNRLQMNKKLKRSYIIKAIKRNFEQTIRKLDENSLC